VDSNSTTDLFRVCSRLFLFLSSFRQKVRRGVRLEPDAVAADLEEIFDEQARAARSDPRLDALYEKARYPLVVLADEILLHSGWDHSAEWEQHLFEEKYFKTNIGGDQFFSIAKDLRPDDVELAAIVFTGLALGFRGKYRERPEKAVEIKNRVYRLLAEYLADVGEKITPEAYHVTAAPARKLSPAVTLARVAIVGVGILFLYYAITWLMWARSVDELRTVVQGMGLLAMGLM
jgi:type IV/VI secretion system ImpK/VasF family protein